MGSVWTGAAPELGRVSERGAPPKPEEAYGKMVI